MDRPLGVYHFPVVSFSAQPPSSGKRVWTSPLPKVVVPMTRPRSWSCRLPAMISEADAEPPFTSTTSRSVPMMLRWVA